MEIRHAHSPDHIPALNQQELRNRFLVENVFETDAITAVYSHEDRVVIVGAAPASAPLTLPSYPELRTDNFFERREAGIVNVGGAGTVTVDDEPFAIAKGGCLYVGRGATEVTFASDSPEDPAKFYLYSAPAHTTFPTRLANPGEGTQRHLGDQSTSNKRTINQYIHENGIQSCQVVMGVTTLHDGSMWNTMPAHTHARRMEAYLYFDIPADQRVVHLMGQPSETRHMIVANEQAIISPAWSIHCGVGTASYSFVWAMAGENQAFDDMDPVTIADMM